MFFLLRGLNVEIENMSEAIALLQKEIKKYKSAHLGSRSNTCSPAINQVRSPIQLPSIVPTAKASVKLIDSPCIMFTRLDAERNIKRMKKAIARGFLNEQSYEVYKNKNKLFFFG